MKGSHGSLLRTALALGLVAAHLVFLPWAIGTMTLWAQVLSAALAAIIDSVEFVGRR